MMEEMGLEKFREILVEYTRRIDPAFDPQPAAPAPTEAYERRDIVGVHPQKQEGKSWVCVTIPAGRLMPQEVSHGTSRRFESRYTKLFFFILFYVGKLFHRIQIIESKEYNYTPGINNGNPPH